MPNTATKVLLRACAELSFRSAQIRRHLDEITKQDSPEYRRIAQIVGDALTRVDELVPATLAGLASAPKMPGSIRNELFFRDLFRASSWFAELHQLLVYLPSRAAHPQTRTVLQRCFADQYEDVSPSVVLGSLFNASEFDFFEQLGHQLPDLASIMSPKTRGIVLELPLCDRHTPSAWSVLAHEMGHAIDLANGISERAANSVVKHHHSTIYEMARSWAGELTADLIAANFLGPASILSLLSLEYCLFPIADIHLWSDTHPTTKWRLAVVSDYLEAKYGHDYLTDARSSYEDAWEFSLTYHHPDPTTQQEVRDADSAFYDWIIKPLTVSIEAEIAKLVPSQHTISSDSLERCVLRLRQNLPVSSQGDSRASLRAELADYRAQAFPTETARFEGFGALLQKFSESPVTLPTVLLSCHLLRQQRFEESFSDISIFKDVQKTRHLMTAVTTIEYLVLNSIGTGAIHEQLIHEFVSTP